MKYIIGICLILILSSATSVVQTKVAERSTSQVVSNFTGENCLNQAQGFIVAYYKDGYKVTYICNVASQYSSDRGLIVVMEK